VCYKRFMRKWMRDRMKRRKKSGDSSSQGKVAAPAPLQPKYFENEPEVSEPEVSPTPPQAAPEPEPTTQPAASPAAERPPKARPSRRRRGRRGRGRRSTSPAETAPLPAPEAEPTPVAPVPAPPPLPAPAPMPAVSGKGTVVLAIGLPGSGKSSWFKRHNIRPLSSDLLRQLLFDDADEQRFQDLVFSNLRSMLKARLIARRPMNYVDATNLTPHDRQSWIKLAKDYGYDVQGVFFDVPLELCLERNQRRQRMVGEDVMRKMAAKLKPPTFDEGFSKITVVRVKKKDNVDDAGEAPGD